MRGSPGVQFSIAFQMWPEDAGVEAEVSGDDQAVYVDISVDGTTERRVKIEFADGKVVVSAGTILDFCNAEHGAEDQADFVVPRTVLLSIELEEQS